MTGAISDEVSDRGIGQIYSIPCTILIERFAEVGENLDNPICEVLGFKPKLFRLLPRGIVQFIGKSEEKELAETTFREFVTHSGNGLRPKDATISDKNVLARVGAARISKWLERLV